MRLLTLLGLCLWFSSPSYGAEKQGPAFPLLLRDEAGATELAKHFDPYRTSEHSGWIVDVIRSPEAERGASWKGDAGWLALGCCDGEDTIPLQVRQRRHSLVVHASTLSCPDDPKKRQGSEADIEIKSRPDGAFDVRMCGRALRMVRSERYNDRDLLWRRSAVTTALENAARRWPGLTRDAWHGHRFTEECVAIAIDCDSKNVATHFAAACSLDPAKQRALIVSPTFVPFETEAPYSQGERIEVIPCVSVPGASAR